MNMKDALVKFAQDSNDKELEKRVTNTKDRPAYRKRTYYNPAPPANWSLNENEIKALVPLSVLTTFDKNLGCRAIEIYAPEINGSIMIEKLIAHTALVQQSQDYYGVAKRLQDTSILTLDNLQSILELVDDYIDEINTFDSPMQYIPLFLCRQSLLLMCEEDDSAMQTYLSIYEEQDDAFVNEGVHTQIYGFINRINQNKKYSPVQAKALYVHAKEMLSQTPAKDKKGSQKYIDILEKISTTGTNEKFEADAAKEAGIAYRKRLRNFDNSKKMHQRALKISAQNSYPTIAAFSHLELGKLEKDFSIKKKHFEESLQLGIETKRQDTQAMAHHELGDLESKHNYEKAYKHLTKSLDLHKVLKIKEYVKILEDKLLALELANKDRN